MKQLDTVSVFGTSPTPYKSVVKITASDRHNSLAGIFPAGLDPDLFAPLPVTAISRGPAGFHPDTAIATPGGIVTVASLAIGDLVLTVSGTAWPVKWIGHVTHTAAYIATHTQVQSILIRAGALGGGLPRRGLRVAGNHALGLAGLLMPAEALVNGVTILHDPSHAARYIHVELERHDLILAEGAAAETFAEDGSRRHFDNAASYRSLYPDPHWLPVRYCAARVENGAALEAMRLYLADVSVPAPGDTLQGCLDQVGRARITGWARQGDHPVRLRILDNGIVIGSIIADGDRADLVQAGIGPRGFDFIVPGGLSPDIPHVIQAMRDDDGAALQNSPWHLAVEPVPVPALPFTGPGIRHAGPGSLDQATRLQVKGWAQDSAATSRPVALQILDNGVTIARVLANGYRADLEQAGIGNGWHGFELDIPGGLPAAARHVIQVKREQDGTDLPGSPVIIEAATTFDPALQAAIVGALQALASPGAQDEALAFMAGQTAHLLQHRADRDGDRASRRAVQQYRRRWDPSGSGSIEEPGLRALVIDEWMPDAGRDAGSQAVLSHIEALQHLGYDVSFAAADDSALAAAPTVLAARGVSWCGRPFYGSVEDVLRRQAGCFDVVYLHRSGIAARYMALVRAYDPAARVLYSVADLHHVRMARQAVIEDGAELLVASRRIQVAECLAAWSADAVITHSTAEAEILRQDVPEARVHHVPWAIPLQKTAIPFQSRHGVAFIGHYAHPPNEDAARWLAETIMPLVWAQSPEITCILAGSAMPGSVKAWAGPGIEAPGYVPDLATGVFDRVRLTVAPLRYGAGVKGKVLESFGAGIPCAMSTIAAEGIALPASLGGLVAHDAAGLAAMICRLHGDEAENLAAAQAGLAMIRTGFNTASVAAALGRAIDAPMHIERPLS